MGRAETVVYLVRHADAGWSVDEMRPLSPQGLRDARRVADILSEASPAAIYSSPYTRALSTVAPLAERLGLPILELNDLRERSLPRQWVNDFETIMEDAWNDPSFGFSGGESGAAARQRVIALYQGLIGRHRGEAIVVATHGTLMTLLLNHLDRSIGLDLWRALSLPDIYRLSAETEGGVSLARLWS